MIDCVRWRPMKEGRKAAETDDVCPEKLLIN